MNQFDSIKGRKGSKDESVQCAICEEYIAIREGFYCTKCRKGPLCKKHRVLGRKECISCVLDIKVNEINALRRQENSLKSVISYLQFLLILCAILFITLQLGVLEEVEFLKNNIFTENLTYIGIGTAVLYTAFYIVMLSQRKNIADLESEIESMGMRRY